MRRIVDTEIWKKPWFRRLSPSEKSAWKYITDTCDNVGVWEADFELAEFSIGESIDWASLPEKVNGNIIILESGKWWLVDFCAFQHPDLDEESRSKPIQSYIALLKKHGLWEAYLNGMHTLSKGHAEAMHSLQGKGMGKGNGKGTGKGEGETTEIQVARTRWRAESLEATTLFTFQRVTPMFTDQRGNLDAIPQLVTLARARGDPGDVLPAMIQLYERLRTGEMPNMTDSNKRFWSRQPFTPKGMLQVWERLEPEAEAFIADAQQRQRVKSFLDDDEEDENDVDFG